MKGIRGRVVSSISYHPLRTKKIDNCDLDMIRGLLRIFGEMELCIPLCTVNYGDHFGTLHEAIQRTSE